jgi:hypothetical protein
VAGASLSGRGAVWEARVSPRVGLERGGESGMGEASGDAADDGGGEEAASSSISASGSGSASRAGEMWVGGGGDLCV